MPTTFRTDIADGLLAVLNTYATANPGVLKRAYRARPASFPDLPLAFVENRPESITHTVGVRQRVMTPSVVVVDRITDNAETALRLDQLVDALVDAFSADPDLATGTAWGRMTVTDEELAFGEYEFAAVRFTFEDVTIQEARP